LGLKLPLWYNSHVKLKIAEDNLNAKKDLSAKNQTPRTGARVQATDVNSRWTCRPKTTAIKGSLQADRFTQQPHQEYAVVVSILLHIN
jgi:hypothetical protein